MKIVRTDGKLEAPRLDAELRAAGHELVVLPDGVDEAVLHAELREAELLLMCYTPVTEDVIAGAEKLKGIVKYGVGIDAIDIPAAMARGIPVVNIPEYAEETVAEGAFALMLALAKGLHPLQAKMQSEGWAWPEPTWMAHDIAGSTVGVIGMGRIATSFARMAGAGFRARVLAYSPHTAQEKFDAAGATRCPSLHGMLAECDYVAVLCVLNEETRHMVSAAEFAAMKPGACMINVSRGAIVDEQALIDALDQGQIAGAALDVFSAEPLALEDHPLSGLFGRDNVLLSPHLTFYTAQAMERMEAETLERCFEVIEGRAVTVKSHDARLRAQTTGVRFVD